MTQHGISSFLLSRKLVSNNDLDTAIRAIDNSNEQLITHLIDKKLLDSKPFAIEAANFFNLPLFDLTAYNLECFPRAFLNERLINDYSCLPLYKRGHSLLLATSDPLNLNAMSEFRFFSNLNIEQVIVEDTLLKRFIKEVTENTTDTALKTLEGIDLKEIELDIVENDNFDNNDDFDDSDEPVIKYINKIIVDAINRGASDIHFEPYAASFRIRYRIDGLLQEVASPPLKIAARTAAKLKIMSQLNIAEKRIPQDGRFKLKVSKTHVIDFRVSTCPTTFGEKVVLRVLDQAKTNLSIDKLGFEPHQQEIYLSALKQSQGMILVTGPTGSGKTVTLYTGLHIINTIEKNISTAEDPVEINVNGINQVQINNKQGLTFARALKSFLRQDPDVIMIGEIRDFETADIAIKAAQTGHLVLSTVHTNSAPETLNRLLDMGIPHYNIISSISLIIAQRLARKLCPYCKKPAPDITREFILNMGIRPHHVEKDFTVYTSNPNGCARCFKGFRGRVAIYEVMPLSLDMSRLIVEGRSTLALAEQAQNEGIDNLQQSALVKVVRGITSFEEANRIISM